MLVGKQQYGEILNRIKQNSTDGGCTVYIFVSPECDALCACVILARMFRAENIRYKVKPAAGFNDLTRANDNLVKNNDELRSIVLINCAGIIEVSTIFDLSMEVSCYIIDSHRPIHLGNIFENQGKVFVFDDTLETIRTSDLPDDDDDLSANESESDDESGSESDSGSEGSQLGKRKRKRSTPERRLRRRILHQYYLYTHYGPAAAMIAYELSKDWSKDSNDMLWYAIVGLTSYYVHGNISHDSYVELLQDLQTEVSAKNSPQGRTIAADDGTEVPVAEDGRITFEEDYRFMLYRYWNLYESMFFSDYIATSLQLWTSPGKSKLDRLIAKIGIPLKDCHQKFSFMSQKLKARLRSSADQCSKEFRLDHLLYHTFRRQDGFSAMVSAADLVHSTTALLECGDTLSGGDNNVGDGSSGGTSGPTGNQEEGTALATANAAEEDARRWEHRFNLAYDSLRSHTLKAGRSGGRCRLYRRGIDMAMQLQQAVFQMATSIIERKQVRNSGPFRYTILQNLTPRESACFVQPRVLARLARFVVSAYRDLGKWCERRAKPYVLCAENPKRNAYVVVGVMCPARFEVEKNFLGRAFRYAAVDVKAQYKHDGFDTAAIELSSPPAHFLSVLHDTLSEKS